MEHLKKEKMRTKCSYTRNRNKLMMTMEGGLSSRIEIMESLIVFTDAYEDVLRACDQLEKFYGAEKDSGHLSAVSNELEASEEDFMEVEGIVKGYLSNADRSSVKDPTERLKEEVSKRQQEINRIEHEIERTYAKYKRQLEQSLCKQNSPTELDQEAGKTTCGERRDQERCTEAKSEDLKEISMPIVPLDGQNSNVQKPHVVPSKTLTTSATDAIEKVADCLQIRSPELFIRLRQLHLYFPRTRYHLCFLWWDKDFGFNSQHQLNLWCRSKVKQIS